MNQQIKFAQLSTAKTEFNNNCTFVHGMEKFSGMILDKRILENKTITVDLKLIDSDGTSTQGTFVVDELIEALKKLKQ